MGNSPSATYWGDQIPRLENYGHDERLNIKSIKLYTDGVVILLHPCLSISLNTSQVHWAPGVPLCWSRTLTNLTPLVSCVSHLARWTNSFSSSGKMAGAL